MIVRIIVSLVFLAVLGCKPRPTPYTRLEGNAQGTTFRIVYADSLGRDFSQPIDSLFRVMDHSMSLWDSTSIISLFNAGNPAVRADAHFTAVFNKSREVSEATAGFFDVTVGPLVKAWGFSYKKALPPPDSAQVDSLLKLTGYQKVKLEQGKLVAEHPRINVDFNAIAQGYTVDVLAEFLNGRGIRNYLVEVGGEVRAQGRNERGEVWRVGIDKPTNSSASNRSLQAVVSLANKALATSGSYRKFIDRDGRKYSHAIDPRTGFPITHGLLSISVLANDCMTADAYATAFLVMGLEKAVPLARDLNLEIYGIVANPNGSLEVYQSADFGAEAVE